MSHCRPPAVAGHFYPADADALVARVDADLDRPAADPRRPRAVIVPHAGLVYSGPTAGRVYRRLQAHRETWTRVALFGPCHRLPLRGMAVPEADRFATPLGEIPADREGIDALLQLPAVVASDAHHAQEHSLEVQWPFLQRVLGRFELLPVLVGATSPAAVADAMAAVADAQTLLVVSTDLSHFHDYPTCRQVDGETVRGILERRDDFHGEQACGCHALNGLLNLARQRDWTVDLVHHCNSGDTAGPRDRVVGYGGFAIYGAD